MTVLNSRDQGSHSFFSGIGTELFWPDYWIGVVLEVPFGFSLLYNDPYDAEIRYSNETPSYGNDVPTRSNFFALLSKWRGQSGHDTRIESRTYDDFFFQRKKDILFCYITANCAA
jgi:hypothetical protein